MSNSANKPAILGGAVLFERGLNLATPDLPPVESFFEGLCSIIDTGVLTKGKFLREFERAVAALAGTKEAVGVSSCTSGLLLVHKCLKIEGEVILPSFTFMASALGIVWNNASPVFVDIDPQTWNVDPAKVEESLTERTGAIIATHVFGNPANVDELWRIAQKAGVPLVFDAAHGFGSRHNGVPVGGSGSCEVFSCSPTKLVICGEGGVVTTNNEELACELRCAREYGNVGNYDLVLPGLNARLPEFNALLGLKGLERLEGVVQRRNYLVGRLKQLLGDLPGVQFQKVLDGERSSYKDLTCRIDAVEFGLSRDEVVQALAAEGIDTRNYYDPPCHKQTYWRTQGRIGPSGLVNTEQLSKSALTLPLSSRLLDADIDNLAEALWRLHKHCSSVKRLLAGRSSQQAGV